MPKVSVIYNQDRYQGVYSALNLLKEEIRARIAGKERIVVKPNLCVANNKLATTDVETVAAFLDFLKQELKITQNVVIAEGPFGSGGLPASLAAYRYKERLAGYLVSYVDLNQDGFETKEIFYGQKGIKLNLAKTILGSDFLVSLCPAKTHDSVITTLSVKNVAVGAMVVPKLPPKIGNHTRALIHGSPYKINQIIASVAKYVWPDLAIIDGVVGMEGDGPVDGTPIDFGLTLASLDPLAADSLCSFLMGFDPKAIGYYYYLDQMGLGTADLDKIEVVGVESVKTYLKPFKPHNGYKDQLEWREKKVLKYKIKFFMEILKYAKRMVVRLLKQAFFKD